MNGSSACAMPYCRLVPDEVVATRYLARQPILNLHGRMFAYELLFRGGTEANFIGDGELASRTMFDNMIVFG